MQNTNSNELQALGASATISIHSGNEIAISVEEYTRLKDIETRFTIFKKELLHANYVPLHEQIIFGIEEECKAKQGSEWDPLNPKKKEGK